MWPPGSRVITSSSVSSTSICRWKLSIAASRSWSAVSVSSAISRSATTGFLSLSRSTVSGEPEASDRARCAASMTSSKRFGTLSTQSSTVTRAMGRSSIRILREEPVSSPAGQRRQARKSAPRPRSPPMRPRQSRSIPARASGGSAASISATVRPSSGCRHAGAISASGAQHEAPLLHPRMRQDQPRRHLQPGVALARDPARTVAASGMTAPPLASRSRSQTRGSQRPGRVARGRASTACSAASSLGRIVEASERRGAVHVVRSRARRPGRGPPPAAPRGDRQPRASSAASAAASVAAARRAPTAGFRRARSGCGASPLYRS